MMTFERLKPQIITIVTNKSDENTSKLTQICRLLQENVSYYDWVGFYFKNGNKNELKLHAYAGEPTEHTTIPFGKGICGQVAVSNKNFVVPNVKAQNNYIACSIEVKSEIVIPLFVNGENIGQIDIDSHTQNPFTQADERFLEFINEQVAKLFI